MRKFLFAASMTALLTGSAFAAAVIQVTPEVQTQFRDYVVKQHVAPVTIEGGLAVGTVLPAEVTLAPVPDVIVQADPAFGTYQYVYVGDQIVLVDPGTRKIIQVIQ
jgi:hypothetical protein